MTQHVTIKSYPKGIRIFLSPDIPFDMLAKECRTCFHDSAKFFKDAKLAVSFEGRVLSLTEEKMLLEVIQSACDINILCLIGKDEESDALFVRSLEELAAKQNIAGAQFFRGSLSGGERFETNESVILLGDVAKDAGIMSKKDIIILGGLYGDAIAGLDGNSHFVVALDFYPRSLKIAGISAEDIPRQRKLWGKKQKQIPRLAYLSGSRVLTKEIEFTEELLDGLSTC